MDRHFVRQSLAGTSLGCTRCRAMEDCSAGGVGQAAIIGGLFVLGQIFTYLAFQFGDVSVATPVFGVKVLIVALCGLLMAGEAIPPRIWIAACLATTGVGFVQFTDEDRLHPQQAHIHR